MLVRFTLENWMSFRAPVTFSMVASKERQHGARLPRVAKYQTRLLPIAAIYGGNASGKTNFFRALGFAKGFIIRGSLRDAQAERVRAAALRVAEQHASAFEKPAK